WVSLEGAPRQTGLMPILRLRPPSLGGRSPSASASPCHPWAHRVVCCRLRLQSSRSHPAMLSQALALQLRGLRSYRCRLLSSLCPSSAIRCKRQGHNNGVVHLGRLCHFEQQPLIGFLEPRPLKDHGAVSPLSWFEVARGQPVFEDRHRLYLDLFASPFAAQFHLGRQYLNRGP